MKVFVLLTVALLSGCHANLFYADEPKPQLEQLTDAFWDYVAKATQTADDTLQMIKKSEFGQEVNTRLTQSTDLATQYASTLGQQLPPAAQGLVLQVRREAEELGSRVSQELLPYVDQLDARGLHSALRLHGQQLQGQLKTYVKELRRKLHALKHHLQVGLEQRTAEVQQLVAPYAEELQRELHTLKHHLQKGLEQRTAEVQQLVAPYADSLDAEGLRSALWLRGQQLQELQWQVDHFLRALKHHLQTGLEQRTTAVRQLVAPYAEDLRDKLDPYAQDLQAQLGALLQAFINAS